MTGAVIRTIDGDASDVNSLSVANLAEGVRLVATGPKFVRLIDPITGAISRHVDDDRAAKFCVLSNDGTLAVSGDGEANGRVCFWETATLRILTTVNSDEPSAGVFSHQGTILATDDGTGIILWDVKTRTKLRRFEKSHDTRILMDESVGCALAFTPDDRTLVFAWLGELRAVSVDDLSGSTWAVDDASVGTILVPAARN